VYTMMPGTMPKLPIAIIPQYDPILSHDFKSLFPKLISWCLLLVNSLGGEKEERVTMEVTDEMLKTMEVGLAFRDYNGRISSMDFHSKATNYLVTASDDESIRLYDIQSAVCLKTINSKKYGVELVSSLLTQLLSCIPQRMAGMNLCGCSL